MKGNSEGNHWHFKKIFYNFLRKPKTLVWGLLANTTNRKGNLSLSL